MMDYRVSLILFFSIVSTSANHRQVYTQTTVRGCEGDRATLANQSMSEGDQLKFQFEHLNSIWSQICSCYLYAENQQLILAEPRLKTLNDDKECDFSSLFSSKCMDYNICYTNQDCMRKDFGDRGSDEDSTGATYHHILVRLTKLSNDIIVRVTIKRQTRVTVKCYGNADEVPTELETSPPIETPTNSLYTTTNEMTTHDSTTLQTSSSSDFLSTETSQFTKDIEESTINDYLVHPSDSESELFEKSGPSWLWIGIAVGVSVSLFGGGITMILCIKRKRKTESNREHQHATSSATMIANGEERYATHADIEMHDVHATLANVQERLQDATSHLQDTSMPEYATVNKPPKTQNQFTMATHDQTITQYLSQNDANDPVLLYSEPMINGRYMPGVGESRNKTNGKEQIKNQQDNQDECNEHDLKPGREPMTLSEVEGKITNQQDNPDQCTVDDLKPHLKPAVEPMNGSKVKGRIENQHEDENEADGFIYELQGHVDWSSFEEAKRSNNDKKDGDGQSKQTERDSVMQFVENDIYGK